MKYSVFVATVTLLVGKAMAAPTWICKTTDIFVQSPNVKGYQIFVTDRGNGKADGTLVKDCPTCVTQRTEIEFDKSIQGPHTVYDSSTHNLRIYSNPNFDGRQDADLIFLNSPDVLAMVCEPATQEPTYFAAEVSPLIKVLPTTSNSSKTPVQLTYRLPCGSKLVSVNETTDYLEGKSSPNPAAPFFKVFSIVLKAESGICLMNEPAYQEKTVVHTTNITGLGFKGFKVVSGPKK